MTICEVCGGELHIGDYPFCGGVAANHQPAGGVVIGDDIPGGLEIKNVLCNADGTPRKYYSHSEIRAEAKRRGYHQHVEHVTPKGTDKSAHTVRWT